MVEESSKLQFAVVAFYEKFVTEEAHLEAVGA